MSIEKAVERFREEFPYWRWNGGFCGLSVHATIAPDERISDEMRAFDERFNSGFHADLEHEDGNIRCVGEALEAAMQEARAAYNAWLAHTGKKSKEDTIAVRVDADMKEKLRQAAESEDRTLSNYVLKVLREHLAAREKADKAKGMDDG